jgi:pimeloyl-ACP methyl ester carboxylesterase
LRAFDFQVAENAKPMRIRFNRLKALAILLLIGCGSVSCQAQGRRQIDPAVATLGKGFVSDTAKVNGTTLHYVRGGAGPAVILLHGFPQDWYAFHKVMPRLAKKFTVIAVDLRGIGGSAATPKGYEAPNLAEDINQLIRQLKLERVYVVGHDIGGMVAYAFARQHPQTTRGVMIVEMPLPGLEPWTEVKAELWHFGFHQTLQLPEDLIAGRQNTYFKFFFTDGTFNKNAITDADVGHYVTAYSTPAQLRAGFEFYRAFPANEQFNASQSTEVGLPLTLVAGDNSFGTFMPRLVEDLRRHGCKNVALEIMKDSGHYLADEHPDIVAQLIERYASL